MIIVNRHKVLIGFIVVFLFVFTFLLFHRLFLQPATQMQMVMGGILFTQSIDDEEVKTITKREDVETYFRPSDLPVLNDRDIYSAMHLTDQFFQNPVSEIALPEELLESPEEAIINYFSILREAANSEKGKLVGCGSIGHSTIPYPLAYQFLSAEYKKTLSYQQYLASFENILHTSLIKYKEIPVYNNIADNIRYFIEIETIGGSEKHIANFTYYYGFVDLVKEEEQYKISKLEFIGEDYLCAPYHGWSYDAENSVQIRYGGWCKLIKELYPTIQNGYVKHIYFAGTDGNEYMIEFFQLTNDTDIEIAQYRKGQGGDWELISFNPEKCIKEQ